MVVCATAAVNETPLLDYSAARERRARGAGGRGREPEAGDTAGEGTVAAPRLHGLLREQGQDVALASYDERMVAAARTLEFDAFRLG